MYIETTVALLFFLFGAKLGESLKCYTCDETGMGDGGGFYPGGEGKGPPGGFGPEGEGKGGPPGPFPEGKGREVDGNGNGDAKKMQGKNPKQGNSCTGDLQNTSKVCKAKEFCFTMIQGERVIMRRCDAGNMYQMCKLMEQQQQQPNPQQPGPEWPNQPQPGPQWPNPQQPGPQFPEQPGPQFPQQPGPQFPEQPGPQLPNPQQPSPQEPGPQLRNLQQPSPKLPNLQQPSPQLPNPQQPSPQWPNPQQPNPQWPNPQQPSPQWPNEQKQEKVQCLKCETDNCNNQGIVDPSSSTTVKSSTDSHVPTNETGNGKDGKNDTDTEKSTCSSFRVQNVWGFIMLLQVRFLYVK